MRMPWFSMMVIASAILSACASTPRQTVELSATVGRDLEAVHVAHVALARRYFDRIESDVNSFVDETYRPYMISRSMKDFGLVDKIVKPPASLDALDVMQDFVEAITREIEAYRAQLLQPRARRARAGCSSPCSPPPSSQGSSTSPSGRTSGSGRCINRGTGASALASWCRLMGASTHGSRTAARAARSWSTWTMRPVA